MTEYVSFEEALKHLKNGGKIKIKGESHARDYESFTSAVLGFYKNSQMIDLFDGEFELLPLKRYEYIYKYISSDRWGYHISTEDVYSEKEAREKINLRNKDSQIERVFVQLLDVEVYREEENGK